MRIILSFIVLSVISCLAAFGETKQLVILHTNDTHSQIDPADNGLGGLLRRKAVIDSVRAAEPNVLLVDAGDAVQGSMYFTLYKGEVEYKALDLLGYDIAILGNHDFDNKTQRLEELLADSSPTWLSANYDFSEAPGLDSVFTPYVIKEYGGKKIGVLGINLNPKGMIAEGYYDGVRYNNAYEAANKVADELKRDKNVDYVIAVTHIGYDGMIEPNDVRLAHKSNDIDIIIGGHSHTLLSPDNITDRFNWKHVNANGDTIAVLQTGARGAYIGKTTLDLDNGDVDYSLIKIDSRLDSCIDSDLALWLEPYRMAVDSVMNRPVAESARILDKNEDGGLTNFLGDFVAAIGEKLSGGHIDMGLINSGGVRRALPAGTLSQGMIIDMLPFNNRIVVLDISGADLIESFDVLAARRGSDGVSASFDMTFDINTGKPVKYTINGITIDPNKRYRLATIDYLANGGDYMESLTRGTKIANSDVVLYDALLDYLSTEYKDRPIDGNPERRMRPAR